VSEPEEHRLLLSSFRAFAFRIIGADCGKGLVVRAKQMTPVASSSATPASGHVPDQRGASFETAAPRLPQDEGFS
jgi:hypothetical protein